MSRLLWAVALMALCASVWGQEVNRQDPAAVAKAYLEACEKWDMAAAGQLLETEEAEGLYKLGQEPGPDMAEQILTELLCVPMTKHAQYAVGDMAVDGDEARVSVVVTYTRPQTYVLRKDGDGNWRVGLEESILSTTGAQSVVILEGAGRSAQAACLSNLKQLALAVLQYAQHHDEVLPPAENWQEELYPFIKNRQIFVCPSAPELDCGYAFNAALSRKHLAAIEDPAQTIVLIESAQVGLNPSVNLDGVVPPARHNGGYNVAYADGHAKWLAGNPPPPPPPPPAP